MYPASDERTSSSVKTDIQYENILFDIGSYLLLNWGFGLVDDAAEGIVAYFRFQAYVICWATAIAVQMTFFVAGASKRVVDFLVLGEKRF